MLLTLTSVGNYAPLIILDAVGVSVHVLLHNISNTGCQQLFKLNAGHKILTTGYETLDPDSVHLQPCG